jgi:DNA-binding transcriptional MerR regulator
MAPKLFKAADVCEMAQLQSYVLRSWEKEFPGIGVQKEPDSARLYRQSDVDQVLRIKQLVFGEGLTLSGARRRLEEMAPSTSRENDAEVAEVLDALASNARIRIANVRQGLQSILTLLSNAPGTVVVVSDEYQLEPPPAAERSVAKSRPGVPARSRAAAEATVRDRGRQSSNGSNGKRSRRVGA